MRNADFPSLRLGLGLAAYVVLTGCRSPEPAPPPPPIDIAKVDGAAVATGSEPASSSTDAPAASGTTAASASHGAASVPGLKQPPPPGLYDVTLSDRSNTCSADAGAARAGAGASRAGAPGVGAALLVPVKPVEGGKWAANLPVNTGVGSLAIDRHDVVLEVGHVAKSSIRPDRMCAYEVNREIEVLEVSDSKIVARVRSEYTDAVRCTLPRSPVSCKRDVDVTYTLARPLCAPRCVAQTKPHADGGVEATCSCPDAGAP